MHNSRDNHDPRGVAGSRLLDDTARLPLPAALRILADVLAAVASALRRIADDQGRRR
jgi:hypothetical protein